MKAENLREMFDNYIKEYDNSIAQGDLTSAAQTMELLEEAIRGFRGHCPVITETKIH